LLLVAITKPMLTGMLALIPHTAPTTTATASSDKRLPTKYASPTANAIPARITPLRIYAPLISDCRFQISDWTTIDDFQSAIRNLKSEIT
jgi:hypothetical protein